MLNAAGRSFSGSAQVTASTILEHLTAAEGRYATDGLQEQQAGTPEEAGSTGDRLTAVV